VVRVERSVDAVVYGDGPPGLDPTSVVSALDAAAHAWDLECSGLRFVPLGASLVPPSDADGVTTISTVLEGWVGRGYEPQQAAVPELRYVETAAGLEIVDADVFLNADTIDWTSPDAPDLQGVVVHELGHCGGLAHPCSHAPSTGAPLCAGDPGIAAVSIMHPDYQDGAWQPRADDIEGICHLYPRDPCDRVACDLGMVCASGTCVPAPVCASGDECMGVCASGGELEGRCVPRASEGAPCMLGDECRSRLCLTSMRMGSYCTRACVVDADCGGTQRCVEVEGRPVCAPLPPPSCGVAPVSRAPAGPSVMLWILVGSIGLLVRRKHRPRSEPRPLEERR
jgi:hypothetical protein